MKKKCISKFEILENNFLKEPTKYAEYVMGLTEKLHNLGLNMIASADKGNDGLSAVKFNSMISGVKFMWQIPPRICYSIHDG